ncbi:CBL-interacting serine/threonine-protein kinase 21-like isoform X2 [Dioscorea cayenensis subsp. rotundata]|uniref:non-specific serine/threonine protein kinase n=1 Tax=Dioscorea cayennensis subsp. rotundata TaxID=55577 RepID=A0AB40ATN2_DIOCR|nr:CBL-interacting serine/threonine-protein kinase 21-like isoform X2 [Dioscorea cayenensis subsp. rotundata]
MARIVGKYCLGRMIGEGAFAKVKLAVDVHTNRQVAVKIIDKQTVIKNKIMYQIKREISTMKLLNHPHIVRIYEVIATKTKIYLIMEYASGGQLTDRMCKGLTEREARRYFQQLIDAVDYCHSRGVYHRDLKPENLLLDSEGNLKVSDFGLSTLKKPGALLSTACGSPSYVAPEVITKKNYKGAAADVWSCGVVLFELLAGHLPFEDGSLTNLYRKITRAEYTCPSWFTANQRKLIARILNPSPRRVICEELKHIFANERTQSFLLYLINKNICLLQRATITEIIGHEWFQVDYELSAEIEEEQESMKVENLSRTFDSKVKKKINNATKGKTSKFINAFQLISMSNGLNLSGLFHEQTTKIGSQYPIDETIEKIESTARAVNLIVNRMDCFQVNLHEIKSLSRYGSHVIEAKVIQLAPTACMVEISKSSGTPRIFEEFCRRLSNLLKNTGSQHSTDKIAKRPRSR